MTRIIQGDLCLEKAYKAISAVCLQNFVYITRSHDQNLFTKVMTRIIKGHLCFEKAYKAIFDEFVNDDDNTTLVETTLFFTKQHFFDESVNDDDNTTLVETTLFLRNNTFFTKQFQICRRARIAARP